MSRSRRSPKLWKKNRYTVTPRSYRDLFIAKRRAQVRNAMRNDRAEDLPLRHESGAYTSCQGYYW